MNLGCRVPDPKLHKLGSMMVLSVETPEAWELAGYWEWVVNIFLIGCAPGLFKYHSAMLTRFSEFKTLPIFEMVHLWEHIKTVLQQLY